MRRGHSACGKGPFSVLLLTAAAAASIPVAACGGGIRTAPIGPRPADASGVEVEYPPPPADVEEVPPDPGAPCVWVDGYHTWVGRSWSWESGQWVKLPTGCYRTEMGLVWLPASQARSTERTVIKCDQAGRWRWTKQGWYWTDGTLVVPARACPRASPPRLYYLPPTWVTRSGEPCDGVVACSLPGPEKDLAKPERSR